MPWLRRRREPAASLPPVTAAPPVETPAPAGERWQPWQPIARQFASRVLLLTYSASSSLAEVEGSEQDSDQLQRLYRTDHAITRIRRWAENLQVLAGVQVDDPGRQVTTMLDLIRAATSAVEHYDRVHIGHAVDLAVSEVAADDVIRILTELVDNAVRFSAPSTPVTVSAHLTDSGQVLVRVEDVGIGLHPGHLPQLNALLDGAAHEILDDQRATHLGLLVVGCLTRAHPALRAWLSPRQPTGTVAMLGIGTELVCDIPGPAARPPAVTPPTSARRTPPAMPPASSARLAVVSVRDQPPPRFGQHPGLPHPGDAATALLPAVRPNGPVPMPRRVPGSVRDAEPATRSAAATAGAHRRTWHDEAADFAAGIDDARPTEPTRPPAQRIPPA